MTAHAFQVFINDHQQRDAVALIRSLRSDHSHFAIETRDPLTRAWERWTTEQADKVVRNGQTVRTAHWLETPVTGEPFSFSHTFTSPA